MDARRAVRRGKALYARFPAADGRTAAPRACCARVAHPPIHQPSYSMFNRWVGADLLGVLGPGHRHHRLFASCAGTERALSGHSGLLAHRSRTGSETDRITADKLEIVGALNRIALARGQTLAQMALAWLLRDKRVTSVLMGASSAAQISENAAALKNLHFSVEELAQIDRALQAG